MSSALRLPFPSEQLSVHQTKEKTVWDSSFKNSASPLHRLLPVPSLWDFLTSHSRIWKKERKKQTQEIRVCCCYHGNNHHCCDGETWRRYPIVTDREAWAPQHLNHLFFFFFLNNGINAPRLSKSNSDVISHESSHYSGCHSDHTASRQAFFSSNSGNTPLCLTYSYSR